MGPEVGNTQALCQGGDRRCDCPQGGEGWAVCLSWTAEVGHKPQVGDVIELSQRTKLVQAGSWSVSVLLSKEQTWRWNEKSKQLGGKCL